jgi:hypothetical protein
MYATEREYKNHYERVYCRGPIHTFDGIDVWFRKDQFEHCFYESSKRDDVKDYFSRKRAERIDWIQAALQDPLSDLYLGWDKKQKRFVKKRRVALVQVDYVVVIEFKNELKADFITAFVADTPHTLQQIQSSPRW